MWLEYALTDRVSLQAVVPYVRERTTTAVDARLSNRLGVGVDPDGRSLGDVAQAPLGFAWGVRASRVPVRLGLALLHRQRDILDGVTNRNSGGLWVYLTPGIAWDMTRAGLRGVHLSPSAEVPVHRDVNGLQLTEDLALIAGIRWAVGRSSGF
jgi:hypothetical protein